MKKILLSFLGLIILCTCEVKRTKITSNCCEPAQVSMASFAGDPSFIEKHENPLSIDFEPTIGEMISFKTDDGTNANAFLCKASKPSNKYLIVIQEWWGLNDYIKKEAEKYAKDLPNVNVIALDMYDGKVTNKREEAAELMKAFKTERGKTIILGAKTYMGKNAKISTVGWCFGGAWALQTALILGKQVKGCVMYYGMPEKDKDRLKGLKAEVLGIFGSQDKWITGEVVQGFEGTLKELGKKYTIKSFDADHAFANPSNPKYNEKYANEAYTMSLAFIKGKI